MWARPTVLSHPSTVPSPPDEARRLQPETEFLTVPVFPLQARRRLRRGAHRGVDGGVALQCGAEFWELLAERVQRVAAAELDACVCRVPPQGSQQRARRGLRRQTREVRALQQQVAQRKRGLVRSDRILASFFHFSLGVFLMSCIFPRRMTQPQRMSDTSRWFQVGAFFPKDSLGVFVVNLLSSSDFKHIDFFKSILHISNHLIFKDQTTKRKQHQQNIDSLATPTWLQFGSFECTDWNHFPALSSWNDRKLAWRNGQWSELQTPAAEAGAEFSWRCRACVSLMQPNCHRVNCF